MAFESSEPLRFPGPTLLWKLSCAAWDLVSAAATRPPFFPCEIRAAQVGAQGVPARHASLRCKIQFVTDPPPPPPPRPTPADLCLETGRGVGPSPPEGVPSLSSVCGDVLPVCPLGPRFWASHHRADRRAHRGPSGRQVKFPDLFGVGCLGKAGPQ